VELQRSVATKPVGMTNRRERGWLRKAAVRFNEDQAIIRDGVRQAKARQAQSGQAKTSAEGRRTSQRVETLAAYPRGRFS